MSYLPFGATCCKDLLTDSIDALDLLETHKRISTELPPSTDPLRLKYMLHRCWHVGHYSKQKINWSLPPSDFDKPLLTPIFSNYLDTPRTQYMQIQLSTKPTLKSSIPKSILKPSKKCTSLPFIPNDHGLIINSSKCLNAKLFLSRRKRAKIPLEKALVTFLWQVEQRKSIEYDSPFEFRRDSKYSSREKLPICIRNMTETITSTILRPDDTYDYSKLPVPTKSPRIVKCDPSFWDNDTTLPYHLYNRRKEQVKSEEEVKSGDELFNRIEEQFYQIKEKAELVIDTVSEVYDRWSSHELVTRTTDIALNVKDVCSMAKTVLWNMNWF